MLMVLALALASQIDVHAGWPLANGRYAETSPDGMTACDRVDARTFELHIVRPNPHADTENSGTVSIDFDAPVDGDYVVNFYGASSWGATGMKVIRIDGGEPTEAGHVVEGVTDAPLDGRLTMAMSLNLEAEVFVNAGFYPDNDTDPVRELGEIGRLRAFTYCG